MNKFVILKHKDSEYIVNVSQITCIVKHDESTSKVYLSGGNYVLASCTKTELLEMLVIKPWYVNMYNALKYVFSKRAKNEMRKL